MNSSAFMIVKTDQGSWSLSTSEEGAPKAFVSLIEEMIRGAGGTIFGQRDKDLSAEKAEAVLAVYKASTKKKFGIWTLDGNHGISVHRDPNVPENYQQNGCAQPTCLVIGTVSRCAKCYTHYCSQDCQKLDWQAHKKICGSIKDKKIPPSQGIMNTDKASIDELHKRINMLNSLLREYESAPNPSSRNIKSTKLLLDCLILQLDQRMRK